MTQIVPPQPHHSHTTSCSYLALTLFLPCAYIPCSCPAPTLLLPGSYSLPTLLLPCHITICRNFRRSSPPWARLVLGTPRGVRLIRQWASASQCAEQEEERQEEVSWLLLFLSVLNSLGPAHGRMMLCLPRLVCFSIPCRSSSFPDCGRVAMSHRTTLHARPRA